MSPELIQRIRVRALDPASRTDFSHLEVPEIAPPISQVGVLEAENLLGFKLWTDYVEVLSSIGNGGFGPGDGLIGLAGGRVDHDGRSVLQLRTDLFVPVERTRYQIIPISEWGDGIWSCLDCATGTIVSYDENGLTTLGQTFEQWFDLWVRGQNLWEIMYRVEKSEVIDPRSGRKSVISGRITANGFPWPTFRSPIPS